jgi:hypothetical protein
MRINSFRGLGEGLEQHPTICLHWTLDKTKRKQALIENGDVPKEISQQRREGEEGAVSQAKATQQELPPRVRPTSIFAQLRRG